MHRKETKSLRRRSCPDRLRYLPQHHDRHRHLSQSLESLMDHSISSRPSLKLHAPITTTRVPDVSLISADTPSGRLSTRAVVFHNDCANSSTPSEGTNSFNVPQEDFLVPTTEQPDDHTQSRQFEINGEPVGMSDAEILEDDPDRCRRSLAPSPEPSNPLAVRNFNLKLRIFKILMKRALSR